MQLSSPPFLSSRLTRRFGAAVRGCGLGVAAAFALASVVDCGKDEPKKTAVTPDPNAGPGDNGGNDGGGDNLPDDSNKLPGGGSDGTGDDAVVITDTSVTVTIDDVAGSKPGKFALYANGQHKLVVYPYDYCAWVVDHAYDATPKTASGAGLVLDIPGMGWDYSDTPKTYTITPAVDPSNGASYDKHVVGQKFNGDCSVDTRYAKSGTIKVTKWEGGDARQAIVEGTVENVVLFDNASGKQSSISGKFVTAPCTVSQKAGVPTAASDTAACNPVQYK